MLKGVREVQHHEMDLLCVRTAGQQASHTTGNVVKTWQDQAFMKVNLMVDPRPAKVMDQANLGAVWRGLLDDSNSTEDEGAVDFREGLPGRVDFDIPGSLFLFQSASASSAASL